MTDTSDQHQRTEEPTQKRLEEARSKGDAPKSQEAIAAAMLAAGVLGLWLLGPGAAQSVLSAGAPFIAQPHQIATDPRALQSLFAAVAMRAGAGLAGLALLLAAAALLANLAQARPVFTAARMRPDLSKISPLAGLKRVFGATGLFNFAKGVGKLVIVGSVLAFALWPDRVMLAGLVEAGERALLEALSRMVMKLAGLAAAAMVVIAALDAAWQRHAWRKRLRMTKEEVRRELKETEGDPQIRARLRAEREAVSRRRMMVAVEDATVLIMNPTHFAVALKYDPGGEAEGAPICVAKGVDDLALRMRDIANDNNVPVVQNPPLARALHAAVEIDEEIPIEHYEAVAKVIGFILGRTQSR